MVYMSNSFNQSSISPSEDFAASDEAEFTSVGGGVVAGGVAVGVGVVAGGGVVAGCW